MVSRQRLRQSEENFLPRRRAPTDAITWAKGNRYTFRLRPSNYMQAAMLVKRRRSCRPSAGRRSRRTIEYGQSAVAVFKKLMSEKRPTSVGRRAVAPQGKIDAGPVVQARSKPPIRKPSSRHLRRRSGKLVREGNTRGLFKDRAVSPSHR